MGECLKKYEGTNYVVPRGNLTKYFDPIYFHKDKSDQKFMMARERTDVIDEEIRLCGYFVIITSKKMTAEETLDLYKSRDASEKLFKIDQQKEVVLKIKEKYDAAVAELERLMRKRDEARNKEILQAIAGSDKSYEEIMRFLGTEKEETD